MFWGYEILIFAQTESNFTKILPNLSNFIQILPNLSEFTQIS